MGISLHQSTDTGMLLTLFYDTLASPQLYTCILAAIALWYVAGLVRWNHRSHGRPSPPGPKGWPFLGNISDIRKPELWKAHRELCETYGEIVELKALGQRIIVLGSPRAIFEILEKRSAQTSDRLQSIIISLVGQEDNFAIMPYGPRWRGHRRAFWQYFLPPTEENQLKSQRDATHLFLRKILADHRNLREHIRYSFTAAIVKVVYGVEVASENDPYIALMEQVLESAEAFTPGAFMVELLPWLRHVPAWVPGAGFQKTLARWHRCTREVQNGMAARTEDGMASGETSESVVAKLIEKLRGDKNAGADALDIPKNIALTAYLGGADTTYATLQSFFIAMFLYPEVQRKAQAELDAIVGPHRLPDHSDRPNLPYINALVKEAVRWIPALPFSLPHMNTEDMEYNGYFIPAGSILLPNTWACLHDPEAFPDPDRFMPERFLRDGELDPTACDPARFAFGYGRRICPGRYYADGSLFINVAMTLHVFNISPPMDENGKPVHVELKLKDAILTYPEDCRCTIEPRSQEARELILRGAAIA